MIMVCFLQEKSESNNSDECIVSVIHSRMEYVIPLFRPLLLHA